MTYPEPFAFPRTADETNLLVEEANSLALTVHNLQAEVDELRNRLHVADMVLQGDR